MLSTTVRASVFRRLVFPWNSFSVGFWGLLYLLLYLVYTNWCLYLVRALDTALCIRCMRTRADFVYSADSEQTWRLVHQWSFLLFWLFLTIGTLLVDMWWLVHRWSFVLFSLSLDWFWPLVYQSSHVYQVCTNSVPIVKNSQNSKNNHWCTNRHMSTQSLLSTQSPRPPSASKSDGKTNPQITDAPTVLQKCKYNV